MTDLSRKVRELIAETIKGCPVAPEAMTDDMHLVHALGADSLEGIEIGIAAEEEFGIDLSDDDLDAIQTVGDLVATVEARLAQGCARGPGDVSA